MAELTLHIEGMSCNHCLNAVNQALRKVPGVEVTSVQMGRADLRYDEQAATPEMIAEAVSAEGYRATVGR